MKRQPKRSRALFHLGRSLQSLERWEEAAETFEKGIGFPPPENIRFGLGLARCQIRLGRLEEAQAHLERMVARHPKVGRAWLLRGVVAFEDKRYTDSVADMRKAIDNGYRVPESHLRLGMALGMTGRFDEAQGSLDEALSRDSGLATAYYYKGLFLFQEGEALAAGPGGENPFGIHALRLLERSQAMTPNPRTALVLSEAYLRVGQQMRALEAAAAALQTPRLAPEALRFQAVAHHELLEYEAAEKTYRAAIEAGADSAELYHDFGNLLSVMGRSEEAKGMLEEALSRDGDYPGAHLQIGIAYVNLREFEKALTHLERFLAFAPASAEGWYQKGLVESRRSNPEAAVASWRKALELDPGQSRLLYRLGAELVKLGRVEERTALLTKFEEKGTRQSAPKRVRNFTTGLAGSGTSASGEGRSACARRRLLREGLRGRPPRYEGGPWQGRGPLQWQRPGTIVLRRRASCA